MSVHPLDSRRAGYLHSEVSRLECENEALFLARRDLEKENERLRQMLADLTRGTREIADANRLRRIVSVTGLEPDVGLPYASIGTGDLPSEDPR